MSIFDKVARDGPALKRANELQDCAGQIGFEWADIESVYDKIKEETDEVREAHLSGDRVHLVEELGDLLSIVSRLAHAVGVDAEDALRRGNDKFEQRMRHIETRLEEKGLPHKTTPLDTLFTFWKEAKIMEKAAK